MRAVRTVRSKLVLVAVAPVLLMALAAFFASATVSAVLEGVGSLFDRNYFLQELLGQADAAKANLSAYMETKNSDSLRRFYHYSRLLSEKAAVLDEGPFPDEGALLERNVGALLVQFIAAGDAAVQAKRGRDLLEYGPRLRRVEELSVSIRERCATLSARRLDSQLEAFSAFSAGMRTYRALSSASLAAALLFAVAIVLHFSYKLSEPIVHLGEAAGRISRGLFDDGELAVEADDEIGAAARAFNLMKRSVKDSFDALRAKADMERALMEEQVKNLQMAGLLRNAELSALQARINPHFLFNTLNAGIQLAVVEDAERTRTFLERVARLLRYSLRDLDAPVALREEADCLEAYLYLMGIRFPGVFDFKVEVDPDAAGAAMPKMIVQPLAENAVRHGLQDMTSGARLSVRAERRGGDVVLTVEDNGRGISPERAAQIMAAADSGAALASEDGGGLGLANVIRRLRLFTGRDDVFRIEAAEPSGTRVVVAMPYREEA